MRISRSTTMLCLLAAAGLLAALGVVRSLADRTDGVSSAESLERVGDASARPPRPSSTLGASNGSRTDFDGASDLYAYLQGQRAGEAAGDAEALWNVSRVQDYCAAYASDPAAYDRDSRAIEALKGNGSSAMAAARDRVGQRCRRFGPGDDFSLSAVLAKRVEAARAGSLPAEAALLTMGEPLAGGDAYAQDLVQRVQRSGDPEAYLAISPAMGIAASGREAYFGRISGTQYSELAWQIAACRLGADCSARGVLMTSYCANGGICSRDGSQDFYAFVLDAGVPRQGAEGLNEMVDSLLSSDIGVKK